MRILWLNPNLLLPLDKGGKLRTWHLLRHLSRRHDVTYLAFAEPSEIAAHSAAMSAASTDLIAIPRRDPDKDSLAFYAGAAGRLLDPLPYAVAKYRSRAYRKRVRTLLDSNSFDRVVCDFLVPAVNMPRDLPCPSVLFTHNVEAEIWRRHAETAPDPLRRRLYTMQWRRMQTFEGRTLARFDRVLAVSDADRQTFYRLYPRELTAPVFVIPTGVDTTYFEASDVPATSRHLVFTGSMDWIPNEDAMRFFCRDIFPRIRAAEPDATLSIVGRRPTHAVRQLAEVHGVEVTGSVEDVRPHLARGAVYIVPLRIGGGTRLKIFEAMAAGKAVVSTTIGAEGLPVESGKHLAIADTPEEFAATVIRLLRNPAERHAIAHAARALMEARYDWSAVSASLEQAIIDSAPGARPQTPIGAPVRKPASLP
jgi:sugar transferase (PEP-CTERM/EpsH1 system associated)